MSLFYLLFAFFSSSLRSLNTPTNYLVLWWNHCSGSGCLAVGVIAIQGVALTDTSLNRIDVFLASQRNSSSPRLSLGSAIILQFLAVLVVFDVSRYPRVLTTKLYVPWDHRLLLRAKLCLAINYNYYTASSPHCALQARSVSAAGHNLNHVLFSLPVVNANRTSFSVQQC